MCHRYITLFGLALGVLSACSSRLAARLHIDAGAVTSGVYADDLVCDIHPAPIRGSDRSSGVWQNHVAMTIRNLPLQLSVEYDHPGHYNTCRRRSFGRQVNVSVPDEALTRPPGLVAMEVWQLWECDRTAMKVGSMLFSPGAIQLLRLTQIMMIAFGTTYVSAVAFVIASFVISFSACARAPSSASSLDIISQTILHSNRSSASAHSQRCRAC